MSLDPLLSAAPTSWGIFETLFAWRPDGRGAFGIAPMLATAWELTEDRLRLTLRDRVTFHDGSALTADVVAWNLTRMMQHPDSTVRSVLSAVDPVRPARVLDPLTLQVDLTRPSATILHALSDATGAHGSGIVSQAAADRRSEAALAQHPVGTGPFQFVGYDPGDRLVVERNPRSWQVGADGLPLPYADRATVRFLPDRAARLAALEAGTIDWLANVPGRDVDAVRKRPHATYVASARTGTAQQLVFNARKPPFADNLPLRHAILSAIDRDRLARTLGGGLGIPLPYALLPGSLGYDTAVPTYGYDLARAKASFAESGVSLPFTVRLTAQDQAAEREQAALLQTMLAEVGIVLAVELVAPAIWDARVREQQAFELATVSRQVSPDALLELFPAWADGGRTAYHGATVPGLLETLQRADAEADDRQRHRHVVAAQRLTHEAAWTGPLWFENGNEVVHRRVRGVSAGAGPLREAAWWIGE